MPGKRDAIGRWIALAVLIAGSLLGCNRRYLPPSRPTADTEPRPISTHSRSANLSLIGCAPTTARTRPGSSRAPFLR